MKIGFIGVGNMGAPICRNLIREGHPVRVHDVSPAAVERMTALGAEAVESPRHLAEAAEVVFACLPTPAVAEEVLLGSGGVIEGARAGLTVADFSTNGPALARMAAERLGERGVDYLDCPVAGGVKGAEAATLSVMAGGDAAAFERVLPLFRQLGRNVFHVGPSGAGCVFKILNNMVRFCNMAASNDAFMIVARAGLDPARFLEVLEQSSGGSAALDRMGRKVLKGDFGADFALDLAYKDIGLALALGEETGVPLRFVGVLKELLLEARAQDMGADDVCAMVRVIERSLGTEIRSGNGG
ncbi:MAG: NAD(P)-dependent oxidoreductase [bacterium]